MKISITELRDMVAEAVKRTLEEAPKKGKKLKEIPPVSDESEIEQRDRHVRGLKGYMHSDVNDFSKPLGAASVTKRQGASGMGGWTSESTTVGQIRRKIAEMQIRRLVKMIVGEEVRLRGRR